MSFSRDCNTNDDYLEERWPKIFEILNASLKKNRLELS